MQVLVVGAGILGLAIAREAVRAGHDVIVAEAESRIGTGSSSRNSEVIHAGIYYPTGSLRERHCARSRRMLYRFCESHGVPHRKLGKLVVAGRNADIPVLERLYAQAQRNGVEGLRMLDGAEARRMEPELACVAAFHSPETGIIDSHRYMLALQGDMEASGAVLALNAPVERLARSRAVAGAGAGWKVDFGGREPGSLIVDAVVNAAGHGAQKLAAATQDYPPARVPRLVLAKGNYFAFAGRPVFSRLIYPVPVPGGSVSTSRSTSPAACASARTCNGPMVTTTMSMPAAPPRSIRRSGPTGRRSRTAPWYRIIPASGRSSPGRANRRPIS